MLLAAVLAAAAQDLPLVVVDRDGFELTQSCRVTFSAPLADAGGDGVVRVSAPGVTLDFEGRELRGAAPGVEPDGYSGTGLVIAADGVILRNARVSGFRCGVRVSGARGVVLEACDVSDNLRQRLRSTPEAEDEDDWLWPHENDGNEWLEQYGAGIWAEDCAELTVRRCRARDGQNGLVLDRVVDSSVYDCDFSFLSGWGLALWRSSRNSVTRNALDFCVRGYSHGVYNRGQDSAGILLFEQSSDNVFAENSATHGGDGFFGFAGREALGEAPPPSVDFDYNGKGSNDNVLYGNDFSYAAAHGIELTFSFGNHFFGNRIAGCAMAGIWAGYTQGTGVRANTLEGNADGINGEHTYNMEVVGNTFRENTRGVLLLWDEDPGLAQLPWVRINGGKSERNCLSGNAFEGDRIGIELRGCKDTELNLVRNTFSGVEREVVLEGGNEATHPWSRAFLPPRLPACQGDMRPVGARDHLAGRERILMTEWGPYDFEGPYLRPVAALAPGERRFEVLGSPSECLALQADGCEVDFYPAHVTVRSTRPGGVARYRVAAVDGAERSERSGAIIDTRWAVTVFSYDRDPIADPDGWRAQAAGGATFKLDRLALDYGAGGPDGVPGLPEGVRLGSDRFGTLARTRIALPAGRWRIATTSDDGIRVWADGDLVIDDWTRHAPKENDAELVLDAERTLELRVEHFELDGSATLSVELCAQRP